MKNKKELKESGITLIALVLTIIVLLILAGISVSMLSGENGILKQAANSTERYNEATKNEIKQLGQLEDIMLGNKQNGLDDDRLNNEEIIIKSKDEFYALGRIFLDITIRSNIFSTYISDGKYKEDLALFKIPSEYTTDKEKEEYLRNASYRLESDITIKFDMTNNYEVFFMGIGGNTKKFSGFFNGNGKNIIIEGSDLKLNKSFNAVSLFAHTKDAVIANMNINITEDINILYNMNAINIGIIAGDIEDTTIYNNNVTFNNGSIGVNYIDKNEYYNNVAISSLVGRAVNENKIEKCTVNMNNKSEIYIKHNDDNRTNSYYCGLIVGQAVGTLENRIKINDCNVNMQNSKCYMVVPQQGCIGGVVSIASFTDISNSNITLKNSTIGVEGIYDAGGLDQYLSVCAGGIIGFAQPGSNNTINIGEIGNTVKSCSFKAENDVQNEVLYAKISKGGPPNVGGIIGLAFNNGVINNCNVDIKNAVMIAQRTEESTEESNHGAVIGGIVGRLEHTYQVKDCNVNSQNSKIIAKSTGKSIYCAGIVGYDRGPYHRNVISIENNRFTGNNTTLLELEVISGEQINSKINIGGIAGYASYIMKNCHVTGIDISFKGATKDLTDSNIGKITGRMDFIKVGYWNEKKYFTPDEQRGILNCTYKDININVEGEDTSTIKVGEIYGRGV